MNDIKPGDLVMVVKNQSCGCADSLGSVFVVMDIAPLHVNYVCEHCGTDCDGSLHAKSQPYEWFEIGSLKKIPPLDEPETISQLDEIAA